MASCSTPKEHTSTVEEFVTITNADFSTYTDDELLSLQDSLTKELNLRNLLPESEASVEEKSLQTENNSSSKTETSKTSTSVTQPQTTGQYDTI